VTLSASIERPNPESRQDAARSVPVHLSAECGYASFIRRFLAYLVDNTIIAIYTLTIAKAGMSYYGLDILDLDTDRLGMFVVMIWLLQTIAFLAYFTTLTAIGGTIGKRLAGIRVVVLGGGRISYGRSFVRCLGYYVSSIIVYLGFLLALVDSRRQALHDKMAGTVVVEIG